MKCAIHGDWIGYSLFVMWSAFMALVGYVFCVWRRDKL